MSAYPWFASLWQSLMTRHARWPHALLLVGPRGIGKRDFALALAAARLCETPLADGHACGKCSACHWLGQGSHPDFRLLEPYVGEAGEEEEGVRRKREISIAQVRALSDFVGLSSVRAGERVIMIHPAEAMNTAAANALLKTLEEPHPQVRLILVSHQAHALLPTIKSRCQRIAMPPATTVQARAWLQEAGVKEIELSMALAGGAPLLAKDFAQPTYLEARRTFLNSLLYPASLNWIALAEQNAREDLVARFDWLQTWIYDLSCQRLTGRLRYNLDFVDGLQELAARVNLTRVFHFARELAQIKRRLQHPLNPQLLLESVLLNYLAAVN